MLAAHVRCCLGAIALSCASAASAQWVTFTNQTETRMPTGPGKNSPGVSTTDPEEKDYAWGDVDHDGDVDLLCMRKTPFSFPGGRRGVLFMNQNGVLIDRTAGLASTSIGVPANQLAPNSSYASSQGMLDPTNVRQVLLVDVNNDGWLDAVTCVTIGDGEPRFIGHPRIYMNLGEVDGVWQGFRYEYARIPQLLSKSGAAANPRFCSVAAGDVTADGYVDLYFSDYDTGEVGPSEAVVEDLDNKLLINSGAANPGHFTDQSVMRMGANYNYSDGFHNLLWATFGAHGLIADMNGDGLKDVVKDTALSLPIHAAVLTNSLATPGFWSASNYKVVAVGQPYGTEPGDLNGDGRLDLVIADSTHDHYLLNTGNDASGQPVFTNHLVTSSVSSSQNHFTAQPLVVDLNNDGWNDVIIMDEDLDTFWFGSTRHTRIYRNYGTAQNFLLNEDAPSIIPMSPINYLQRVYEMAAFDIDGDGWRDLVSGRETTTEVWMNVPPPALTIHAVRGLPDHLVPGVATQFNVQLTGVNGGTPMVESGRIYISVNGSPFTQSLMTALGNDLYQATIPAQECGASVRYYFSGRLTTSMTFVNPPPFIGQIAPSFYYEAGAHISSTTALSNDFETGAGSWTVASDPSLTGGGWEIATPNPTWFEGFKAAPGSDHTPGAGVNAFVTQNGTVGGALGEADVDNGATHLISPIIDLAGGNATVSFARWFYSNTPGDTLQVSVSNNDGGSWVPVSTYAAPPIQNWTNASEFIQTAWMETSFNVGDYLVPTSQVRIRFTANDAAPAGFVEAGIDDVVVARFICIPPCPADVNASGSVDIDDLVAVITSWGTSGGGVPADLNHDNIVNIDDLVMVITSWGACP